LIHCIKANVVEDDFFYQILPQTPQQTAVEKTAPWAPWAVVN